MVMKLIMIYTLNLYNKIAINNFSNPKLELKIGIAVKKSSYTSHARTEKVENIKNYLNV